MELYIKQKVFSLKGRFDVFDSDSDVKYTAEGKFFSFMRKLNVYDRNNSEVIHIQQKLSAIRYKYALDIKGVASAEIIRKITLFKPEYIVPDWNMEIKGDFIAHNYQVFRNGEEIARMEKKLFSFGDAYRISIYNPQDELAVLAIILTIDCCMESAQR